MNGTDIVLGYFDKNSNGVIKDYYAEGRKIKEDKSQDIFDTGIVRKDGIKILKFKRKIVTSDTVSLSIWLIWLKFVFSKKATKIDEIFLHRRFDVM